MNFITINTYYEPQWGSRIAGKVAIRKDSQANYSVDDARVVELRVVDLFTVLTCDNGTTHVVGLHYHASALIRPSYDIGNEVARARSLVAGHGCI